MTAAGIEQSSELRDSPLRLGIVKNRLIQGGAERYTFEICRALHDRGHQVDVLALVGSGVADDHYARRLKECGVTVREILPAVRPFASLPVGRRLRALAVQAQYALYRRRAERTLDEYDAVGFVQIENLLAVQPWLGPDRPVVLHLMSHLLQYETSPYPAVRPGLQLMLLCQDEVQRCEAAVLGERILTERVVPLPVNISEFEPLALSIREPLVVATFIRISPERPLLPLFEAFKYLLASVEARFVHFGRGNPATLVNEIAALGVADRVTFAGHTTDMRQSLLEVGAGITWMTSLHDSLGYSSIELAALGVPCLFYDIAPDGDTDETAARTGGAVNAFRTPAELATATLEALRSDARRAGLGDALRAYIQRRHDVRVAVAAVEGAYRAAAGPPAG